MARRKSKPRKRTSRSRTTKRRRTTTGIKAVVKPVKKRLGAMSTMNAHHSVRMDAFSHATPQPKIPDGALTSSLSRSLQHVTSIRNSDGTLPGFGNDTMHIIMAPTLGVPITVCNTIEGKSTRGGSGSYPQFIGFNGQTVGWTNKLDGAAEWPPVGQTTSGFKLTHDGGFAQWRIVSQGLRLELTNTDEENDGWFEACRFNWRRNPFDLCFVPLDGSSTNPKVGVAPNPKIAEPGRDYLASMPMVEQPGYTTGLIRNLKDIDFQLHPQSASHDPVQMSTQEISYKNIQEEDFYYDDISKLLQTQNDNMKSRKVVEECLDGNMDWIYIKLHCRPNSAASVSFQSGSNLLMHLRQNIEVAFGPESDFSTFQTSNKADKRTTQVADALNDQPSATNKRRRTG